MLIDGALTKNYPAIGIAGTSIEKCNVSLPWDSAAAAWHRSGNLFAASGPFLFCTPGAANTSCNDVTPPTLQSVAVVDMSALDVTFLEPVQQIPAETVTNYSLDNGVGTPATATRQPAQNVVRLTFLSPLGYLTYILTVSNTLTSRATPFRLTRVRFSLPFTNRRSFSRRLCRIRLCLAWPTA